MGVLEYSYERHMQMVQDESYDNGYNNGFNLINALNKKLAELGRTEDIIKASQNPEYQKQLIRELVDENFGA